MRNAMQLKAKIKALAKQNKVPAQAIMHNYMLERLLERISLSMKYSAMLTFQATAPCISM